VPTELDDLLAFAQKRGFRNFVAVAIAAVGCLPGLAVALLRPAGPVGNTEMLLIGAIFVFVPTAMLVLWAYRDVGGRAARELVMWLRTVRRAMTDDPPAIAATDLPDVPRKDELGHTSLVELARDFRDYLEPLVASPGVLGVRIAIYRWWYALIWVVSSVVLVIGLVLFAPRT
jgi:hypothetical protein